MSERTETLTQYVGDMHALEKHMLEAFESQQDHSKDVPEAHRVVQHLVEMSRRHIADLERRVDTLGHSGKSMTDAIKSAVSGIFGATSGLIGNLRTLSLSKDMRDNYTVLSLANISYEMLSTTALALNDTETAELAERHLRECIAAAQMVANLIPALVIRDLREEDVAVNADAEARVPHIAIQLGVPGQAGLPH